MEIESQLPQINSMINTNCRSKMFRKTIRNLKIVLAVIAVIAWHGAELSAQRPASEVLISENHQRDESGQKSKKETAVKASIRFQDTSFPDAIGKLSQLFKVDIRYSNSHIPSDFKVNISATDQTISSILDGILRGTNLSYERLTKDILVIVLLDSALKRAADDKTATISGRVIDSASKQGLKGVSIEVSGIPGVVLTDEAGKFLLSSRVSGNAKVTARLVGYKAKTQSIIIPPGGKIDINISMSSSATTLGEVVTTASGQQRRVEVANDIVKIIPDEIAARSPVRTVADILESAQVPGVQVQRGGGDPGAPTKIRIRGISSISQSNDPVVILDGIWIDASVGKPSKLDNIDPASIASIEIIRGPSAATLYGQDASNGVIVITTKKGRPGVSRWDLSYKKDWGQTYGKLPLSYIGVGYHPTTLQRSRCKIENVLKMECIQEKVSVYDPNDPLLGNEGVQTNNYYTLGLDGGSNAITYAITVSRTNTIGVRRISPADLARMRRVGYAQKEGFDRPSNLNRDNITSKLDLLPRKNLTIAITGTNTQTNIRDNSYSRRDWGMLNGNIPATTLVELYNPDTLLDPNGTHIIESSEKPLRSSNSTIGAVIKYEPYKSVVVNSTFGAERSADEVSEYYYETKCIKQAACIDTFGRRTEKNNLKEIFTVRTSISTPLNLGKIGRFLSISPAIGGDLRQTNSRVVSVGKSKVPAGDRTINNGELILGSTHYTNFENATAGWYVNSTIGILNRIYFDMGVRQDIGSAITSSSNAQYPKIGGSWLISDESFWKENNLINLLRLRSAFGHSAVQPDLTDIYGKYVIGRAVVDGVLVRTVEMMNPGNNMLRSERAVEMELGFDADVLYDRLNLVATYAKSMNKNALVSTTLPQSVGLGSGNISRKENIAKVTNRNVEVSATSRIIENANAFVVLNYSLTLSENRVLSVGDRFTGGDVIYKDGYPLTSVWSKMVLGYRDNNGDGLLHRNEVILSDEAVYIGTSQPRYSSTYGVSVTLFNTITLDSRFSYQSQYIQSLSNNNFRYGSEDVNAPLDAQAAEILSLTTPQKPVSDLRWGSASIQYHIPKSLLGVIRGRSASVSLQGSNLMLWTHYVGRDPAVNSAILSSEGRADTGFTPPTPRTFVLDFKIGL